MGRADGTLVVIPARLAATRLPGKPLLPIAGRAMVLHVRDRALEAGIGRVVVASGDRAITRAVEAEGGEAVDTDPALPSGSDRVRAALDAIDPERRHAVVINLQGDLPTIDPADLARVAHPLEAGAEAARFDVATLVAPVTTEAEADSASVVKAVCAFAPDAGTARVLSFSRARVPWGEGPLWHHVGVYAWRREALERFTRLPASPLERRESLEQMRALEDGMAFAATRIARAPFGVDTPDDLARARAAFGAAAR